MIDLKKLASILAINAEIEGMKAENMQRSMEATTSGEYVSMAYCASDFLEKANELEAVLTKPIAPPTAAKSPNIEDDAICYIETDITAFAGVYNADKNGFDVAKNIEGDMFFVPFDLVRGYKVI